MKLRIGSITFLLFLSSVAFPQATSRYLDKPLPQGWEEDTQIFQQVLPVDDQWWKAFQDPFSTHSSPLQSSRIIRY